MQPTHSRMNKTSQFLVLLALVFCCFVVGSVTATTTSDQLTVQSESSSTAINGDEFLVEWRLEALSRRYLGSSLTFRIYPYLTPSNATIPPGYVSTIYADFPIFDWDLNGLNDQSYPSPFYSLDGSCFFRPLNATHIQLTTLKPSTQSSVFEFNLPTRTPLEVTKPLTVSFYAINATGIHNRMNYMTWSLPSVLKFQINDASEFIYNDSVNRHQINMLRLNFTANFGDVGAHTYPFEFGAYIDNKYFPLNPQSPEARFLMNTDFNATISSNYMIAAVGNDWSLLNPTKGSIPSYARGAIDFPFDPRDHAPQVGVAEYGVYITWKAPGPAPFAPQFLRIGEVYPQPAPAKPTAKVTRAEIDPNSPETRLDFRFEAFLGSDGKGEFDLNLHTNGEARNPYVDGWYVPKCTTSQIGTSIDVDSNKWTPIGTDLNRITIKLRGDSRFTSLVECSLPVSAAPKPGLKIAITIGGVLAKAEMAYWKILPYAKFNTMASITSRPITNTTNFIQYNNALNFILQQIDPNLNIEDWHYNVNIPQHYNTTLARSDTVYSQGQTSRYSMEWLRQRSQLNIVFNSSVKFPAGFKNEFFQIEFTQGTTQQGWDIIGFAYHHGFLDGTNFASYQSQNIVPLGHGVGCITTAQCNQSVMSAELDRCGAGKDTCTICLDNTCQPAWRLGLEDLINVGGAPREYRP